MITSNLNSNPEVGTRVVIFDSNKRTVQCAR